MESGYFFYLIACVRLSGGYSFMYTRFTRGEMEVSIS